MMVSVFADGRFGWAGSEARCALGRGGVHPATDKREGDGATPAGIWPVRRVLWRLDKLAQPETRLPARAIRPDDGWCDAPMDGAYNRPVRLPYPASAERMWRDDGIYDVVVVLGYNDDPVVAGAGSAIFMHVARVHHAPTEGCIALALEDLLGWLVFAAPGDAVGVSAAARPD